MDKNKKFGLIIFLVVFVICLSGVIYYGVSYINSLEDDSSLNDYEVKDVVVEDHHEEDIEEAKEKINIYLFWGNGCSHCSNLKAFMASIEEEYGKYYNLYTFEVWSDEDNEDLMNEMASVMGDELKGVPYMIIGKDSYKGYSSNVDSRIKASIKAEYEREDRYDAYEHIEQ